MLNTIDLFAGCGGLTEGFKQSGSFNLVAGVEWDKSALDTLRHRLDKRWGYLDSSERILYFDIQRTKELLNGYSNDPKYGSSVGLNRLVGNRDIDAVIGGPPCQAYSVAGRIRDADGMHNDYRNYLFESYIDVVRSFSPKACIFENVPGMLSAAPGGISIVERVKKAFDEAGYYISQDLKKEALFDVSEYGIPQKRKRVIIFAICKNRYKDYKKKLNDFYRNLRELKASQPITVAEALKDLPSIYPTSNPTKRVSHEVHGECLITSHTPRFHNKRDVEIFRLLAEDIRSGQNRYVTSQALQKLYTERTGKNSAVHKYHVLRLDKPSNTIPAHLYKDGLRHIHPDPEQARSITVREAARFQSFDDDFVFKGSNGACYKMIGNAVPPKFAKKIALALSKVL